jgi:hypothetical protein
VKKETAIGRTLFPVESIFACSSDLLMLFTSVNVRTHRQVPIQFRDEKTSQQTFV